MRLLSIDTSCDETAAAVTEGVSVLSNIVWSQASLHARWGGIVPSLAQRKHQERINWVVQKAINNSQLTINNIDAVAVTIGPGLSIALGVGIEKAKDLSKKFNLPLLAVGHVEAHLLSPLARPKTQKSKVKSQNLNFPVLGLVVSGGNTIFVKINKIGKYEVLAQTVDDALGEALDKGARMLGLGYPGGPILEKFAKLGDPKIYKLPIPLVGQEERRVFSYSGLKTAFYRLVEKEKPLTKEKIYNLAESFQDVAFEHLVRVLRYSIRYSLSPIRYFLVGGGVASNIELRKRLRKLGKEFGIKVYFPYSKKLCVDNAAMVGVAAYLKIKNQRLKIKDFMNCNSVDRFPKLKI